MTKQKLQTMVARINALLPHRQFDLDYAYGGVRLMDRDSRDISPRMSKKEMETWLAAYMLGIEDALAHAHQRANP